jgi:hypothetical protein
MANDINTELSGSTRCSMAEVREHELPLLAKRMTEVPSNMQMRMAYIAAGGGEYVGYAARGLAEGGNGWLLHKITYDSNSQITSRTVAYGSWTNRAAETYA